MPPSTPAVIQRISLHTPQGDHIKYYPTDLSLCTPRVAAYTGLNRTDPDAIWSFQGFAFEFWKNTPNRAADFKVGNKSIGSQAEFQQALKDYYEVKRIKDIGGGRVTPGNRFSGRYDAEALESWVKKNRAKYGSMVNAYRAFQKAQK